MLHLEEIETDKNYCYTILKYLCKECGNKTNSLFRHKNHICTVSEFYQIVKEQLEKFPDKPLLAIAREFDLNYVKVKKVAKQILEGSS